MIYQASFLVEILFSNDKVKKYVFILKCFEWSNLIIMFIHMWVCISLSNIFRAYEMT